ncbi:MULTISPECIES: hypothetical protein [unclassified Solwaraspora]|uniref:hypothetical protein n=2 Tax=Solwaraspora TaxID=265431 RepID=UPI00248D30D1|nr:MULTISPECIES: hypothetical protein [unclassified Solwaraspora]WBB95758.1 hypothetical protein O7553_20640 [Solwaraspora sp. WMMA2059]WJK37511.1 hypothetical protein O7610_14845 [Solwaraspora sp. WMMA2065]
MRTLKPICSPAFTLIEVAKPWIVGSPTPEMSHTELGVPDLLFSQAITLIGGAHGSVDADAAGIAIIRVAIMTMAVATATKCRRPRSTN